MNLSDLKPTWKQFKCINSLDQMDEVLLLTIIEQKHYSNRTLPRLAINAAMFIILTICCQGG